MPRNRKYVPKHRNAPAEPALKKGVRKSVVFSGVAVAATGIAVGGGVFAKDGAPADTDTAATTIAAAEAEHEAKQPSADPAREREREVATSRSDRRTAVDKKDVLDQESGGAVTRTEDLASQDPRDIALEMMGEFGFSESEFSCLDELWTSESDWDMTADNPSSSAYGIPQALTGGTHDLPADYMTNPVTQIRWGLGYIKDSYGTPCAAWEFKQGNNWY